MVDGKIKNLIFDFGGVLVDLDRQRCLNSFKELGVTHIEEYINPFHQQGFFMQFEKGELTPAEFRNKIREISGIPLTDSQIDSAWNSFLGTIPSYKLDKLLSLRHNFNLYLLSNTNAIHWEWSCDHLFPYKEYDVADYFEKIYLSYKMMRVKPNIDIYNSVLADAGINPEETLFLDDSAENCKAAQSLGISAYQPEAGEDWRYLFN